MKQTVKGKNIRAIDQLTVKQKMFLHHYIQTGFNGTMAYKILNPKAKQTVAEVSAARMLGSARMQAALDEMCSEILGDDAAILKVRIKKELEALAFSDIKNVLEWSEDGVVVYPSDSVDTRPVKSVRMTKKTKDISPGDTMTTVVVEVEMYDKYRALETLAKITGLFRDSNVHNGDIIYVEAEGTHLWDGGDHSEELAEIARNRANKH